MAAQEIGKKYPVDQDGVTVPLDDDITEAGPGDILQLVYETEKDLVRQNIRDIIIETLKMKEEYGLFVLHYVKVGTRQVTVQFSVAPHGADISAAGGDITASPDARISLVWMTVVKVIVLAASLAGIIAWLLNQVVNVINQKILRRPPATGNAEVVAKDQETGLPLPNVNITLAGQTKKTGSSGEPAFFKDLIIGTYTVIGATIPNYQPPEAGSVTVTEAAVASCTIWYKPDDFIEPTHGWLSLATNPVEGKIYIHGQVVGEGYAYLHIEKGDYDVYFGTVEGYYTPPSVTLKVVGGQVTSYVAYYTQPFPEWWEKYLKYALIGGGVIIGAAVLIPQITQAATRPRREPPEGGKKT